MSRPRVFISSTFYDLRYIRADLERFIQEIGYEPVQHERGHIPYGSAEKLEKYCYKEIGQVDLVVNVIGGRFGSVSYDEAYSVSQMELRMAVKLNKQVYVFVDANVYSEYRMYLQNKDVKGMQFVASDDKRILSFIEEIEALPRNNQLIEFRHFDDIVRHLREQWAGLFQRFLQEQEQLPDRRVADDLQLALRTVAQLINYLTEERRQQGTAISNILLANHPMFAQLRAVTKTQYPLYLPTRNDVESWLGARGFAALPLEQWDDSEHAEWMRDGKDGKNHLLKIHTGAFDGDGKVRVLTTAEWNSDWVSISEYTPPPATAEDYDDFPESLDDDDDLPF